MKKLAQSRSYRNEHGQFLCDGVKLLEEALLSGADVVAVLTASPITFPLPLDTRLYYADRSLIGSLSPLKNAQDTLFTCRIRPGSAFVNTAGTQILLDGMQDPGNVGAVIRTACAFGIKSVILTNDCADPYNPKAIRASMGAIFKQNICSMRVSELSRLRSNSVRFIGAAPCDDYRDVSQIALKDSVIAIGNEGQGLSAEVLSLCDELITIPIRPQCESLNAAAAAAIIIWEASRQTRET
jgi:TrmH family RNA methyltransferase